MPTLQKTVVGYLRPGQITDETSYKGNLRGSITNGVCMNPNEVVN